MNYLRSLTFYLLLYSFSIVYLIPAQFIFLIPYRKRQRYLVQWPRLVVWLSRTICRLDYTIKGEENIPQGATVVISNHQSAYETVALQMFLPTQTWVLKRELLKIPIFGIPLSALEPVAIDRSAGRKALEQVIEQGSERLNRGLWMVIFPEGTRVPPNKSGRFRIGGAMLAERSGYPVLPIAHNAGEFWPRRSILKKPGTITFSIGPLIESKGRSADEINKMAKGWIEAEKRLISTIND